MKRYGYWVLCVLSAMALGAPQASGQAEKSLNKCQKTIAKEGSKYIRAVADTVGKCLVKASTAVVVDGGAAGDAADGCVKLLLKLTNTADPTKTLAGKFNAKVDKACDPTINPGLAHAESDIYTIGAATLSASKLDAYCASFGGDGSIGDFDEWRDCIRAAADCQARQAIALQWPRALEYTAALLAAPALAANADALAALTAIDTAIEGSTDDNSPQIACGPDPNGARGLPETGKTQCATGDAIGPCPGFPVGQDGETQPGLERDGSFTDNGNGTVSDSITRLMWEKHDDNNSDPLHDFNTVFNWYDALKKMQVLNGDSTGCAGAGSPAACCSGTATGTCMPFLGFTDWRLPTVIELMSILDADAYRPTAYPEFDTGCVSGCTATGTPCSCTEADGAYWSSTGRYNDPDSAWILYFQNGTALPHPKTDVGERARAVRGGS